MITGTIQDREAVVELDVFGHGSASRHLTAIIDTGYNGYLTLPQDIVSALRLPFAGHRRGTLADGSISLLEVYLASVRWHERLADVLVSQTTGTPLIGMALLDGSLLTMSVRQGGEVTISEIQPPLDLV